MPFGGAEQLVLEAIAIDRDVLGPQHPQPQQSATAAGPVRAMLGAQDPMSGLAGWFGGRR